MKKIIYIILLNFFLAKGLVSQNAFNCSSHLNYQSLIENDPSFKKNQQQLEQETKIFIENSASHKTSAAAAYIIPVVFHIIYTTSAGNISDAQVIDQIAILNQEFNRLQPDTVLTPAVFKSSAAPFSVEFRLATIDPSGNCTNGINRIYSTLSNCSFKENDVKSLSYWPSNKYLNVWIVQSMHYSGSMDCVGGGYATFPGGAATLDGINIRGDLISNIGTAAANTSGGNFKGRYLIHELGHWFTLRHIWGDANCGNDLVSDTPPAITSNNGCPNFPRNPSSACAGSTANGEMFTNYMDYTDGPCLNMFTAGQVARMTACMNSAVSGRSNLWSGSNLIATGTNDPYTYPVACAANPEILPYGTLVVCAGDSVKFIDNSYGGLSSSRLWDFPGGSPSSVSDSIVKVQYNTVGIYTVSLTKNYLSTTKTKVFADKVQVLENTPNQNYIFPFSDSFEIPSIVDTDWVIINDDQDQTKWTLENSTAYTGNYCFSVMNFGNSAPFVDQLISPVYDLSSVLNPTLTFRMHFANRITANYDKLVVYITNNCGKTWQQMYSRVASSSLNTVPGNYTSSYVPAFASDDDWRLEKINIINSYAGGKVRFKFVFTSGGGNNIFIDDINIDGLNTTGISTLQTGSSGFKVYPNPAKDILHIELLDKVKTTSRIEIVDVLGKICFLQDIEKNKENPTVNISGFKSGVYIIRIKQTNGNEYTAKFIKYSQD